MWHNEGNLDFWQKILLADKWWGTGRKIYLKWRLEGLKQEKEKIKVLECMSATSSQPLLRKQYGSNEILDACLNIEARRTVCRLHQAKRYWTNANVPLQFTRFLRLSGLKSWKSIGWIVGIWNLGSCCRQKMSISPWKNGWPWSTTINWSGHSRLWKAVSRKYTKPCNL